MLSVTDDGRLAAAVLAWKVADRETQRTVRADTVAAFRDRWRTDVRAAAERAAGLGPFVPMLRAGVTFSGGNPPQARAYQSTRALSGGLRPSERGRSYEFGTERHEYITRSYQSRRGSTAFRVRERHTARQMLPTRSGGYAVWPAVQRIAPDVVAFWVSSIVRAYRLAAEGRRS